MWKEGFSVRDWLFGLLWWLPWWRYLMIVAVRFLPSRFAGWLFYRSGLGVALEDLFRRQGDMVSVQECRLELARLAALYGARRRLRVVRGL